LEKDRRQKRNLQHWGESSSSRSDRRRGEKRKEGAVPAPQEPQLRNSASPKGKWRGLDCFRSSGAHNREGNGAERRKQKSNTGRGKDLWKGKHGFAVAIGVVVSTKP